MEHLSALRAIVWWLVFCKGAQTPLWIYVMAVFDLFVRVVLLKGCLAHRDWGSCCSTLPVGVQWLNPMSRQMCLQSHH